jgi:hypothetical protein
VQNLFVGDEVCFLLSGILNNHNCHYTVERLRMLPEILLTPYTSCIPITSYPGMGIFLDQTCHFISQIVNYMRGYWEMVIPKYRVLTKWNWEFDKKSPRVVLQLLYRLLISTHWMLQECFET